MEIRFGDHCAFDVDDAWCASMSLSFVDRTVGQMGRSITLSGEPMPVDPSVEAYALRQGEVLSGSLENYSEIRLVRFDAEGGQIPVREYRWRQHDTEICQCQAYFAGGDFMWTMTLTSDAGGYDALAAMAPELIRRFSPARRG